MEPSKEIRIVPVRNRRQLKMFIYLPALLHRGREKWVPPIYHDEWKYYNPLKNPAFAYCDVEMALCMCNGEPAGRIMGVINRRHNLLRNATIIRFSNFESINDPAVSGSLLHYIENWGREQGMTEIVGPFGMCYHDPIGYLIEGFEHEPSISTYYNFVYLPALLEAEGYEKKYDLVAYKIGIEEDVPDFYNRIRARVSGRANIRLETMSTRKEMKKLIMPLLRLFNECYNEIDGFTPLDEQEMNILARRYIPVLDPKYVRLVFAGQEPVAFMIGMPNISDGIRRSGGRLFPFGILKILKAYKTATQLDFLLAGVKKKYQGTGVEVLMGYDIIYTARRNGFRFIDSHLEMETNLKVRAEMEKLRGQEYKKYRLFRKSLLKISQ